MNNLDGTDLLQIFGLGLTLIVGFVPSVFPIRSFTGKVVMIVLFGIGVITTIASTISKSSSDKDNYQSLVDSTNTTLQMVNQNLGTSNRIMGLSNESITRLQDIQDKNLALQKEAIAMNDKSSQIQRSSEMLNQKLREEIEIQKQTNKSANDILQSIAKRERIEKMFNQYKFVMNLRMLATTNLLLYDGLQVTNTDYMAKINTLGKDLKNFRNQILVLQAQKNNKDSPRVTMSATDVINFISKMELQNRLVDTLSNTLWLNIEGKKDIRYVPKDSVSAINGIKNFLENTYSMLNHEMTNPFLNGNDGLLKLWLNYSNDIQAKLQYFYVDKTTLYGTKKIFDLYNAHENFINNVHKYKETLQVAISLK